MEEEKKDKTLFYLIETVKLLVENEKTLLVRIQKLEAKLTKLARAIVEDGLSSGNIKYKPDGFDDDDDEDEDDDLSDDRIIN